MAFRRWAWDVPTPARPRIREGNANALLERDDEELERLGRVVAQVAGDTGDVSVVERGINLVEHEERRGTVAGTERVMLDQSPDRGDGQKMACLG